MIWKDIKGYEGIYKISSCGKIKSLVRKNVTKEKLLSPTRNGSGYMTVSLTKNLVLRTHTLHVLVRNHFKYNNNENRKTQQKL